MVRPRRPFVRDVERGGKLPVLPIGDIGLRAFSRLASLAPRAICGPLFFESASWADSTAFPLIMGPVQR